MPQEVHTAVHSTRAYLPVPFIKSNREKNRQVRVSLFVYVYPPPPKQNDAKNELFENGKMSWTASLETNKLIPPISQVPGYGLAIQGTLKLVKMVPLVQGPGSNHLF